MATALIVLFVLMLPLLPFASFLSFVKLPFSHFGWLLLIVAPYITAAELAKKWFYERLENTV